MSHSTPAYIRSNKYSHHTEIHDQSSQIPALKYADRDSQRIVRYFKNRYKLSYDRAMLLTNEEATVIKISRFITNKAMKLLDKNDTFILYFGGHGAPDVDFTSNDNDGLKKYLLLSDSDFDSFQFFRAAFQLA